MLQHQKRMKMSNEIKFYIKGEEVKLEEISPTEGDVLVRLLKPSERENINPESTISLADPTKIHEVVMSKHKDIEVGDYLIIGHQRYKFSDDEKNHFVVLDGDKVVLQIRKK